MSDTSQGIGIINFLSVQDSVHNLRTICVHRPPTVA